MQLSDEIKTRLDIVDVIKDYLALKAAGSNFRGLCPFHQEKTPSFMVSPDKQIWHCFGCGKGGDVFSFVMEIEGMSFVETLKSLAPRAGVEFRLEDRKLDSLRNRLLDIVEMSAKYYNWILTDSRQAEPARKYLAGRGLSDETIALWRLGYSPDSWDDLANFLKGWGFKENEIFLAGMSVKKEGNSRFYNRFRGRIMFPISDQNGHIVAFTARVSPEKEATETMGKYINSPQTQIYDKSKILFGLDKAKTTIRKDDLAILVEGQMDVITAHQHNFTNVVAASGTALAAHQVALLKRYTNNIALAFDNDQAGEMASERGMNEAMAAGMHIKAVVIPSGKDPDECIRRDSEEWRQAVAAAKPMMEHIFKKYFAGLDMSDFGHQEKFINSVLAVIARLGNRIEQDFWLKNLSQRSGAREEMIREKFIKSDLNKYRHQPENTAPSRNIQNKNVEKTREEKLSEFILALLIKYPELVEYAAKRLQPEHIIGQLNVVIYKNLIIYYNIINEKEDNESLKKSMVFFQGFIDWFREISNFKADQDADQAGFFGRLAFLADMDYSHDLIAAKTEIVSIIPVLKKKYLMKRMKEIETVIAEAEKRKNDSEAKILTEELRIISEELRLLAD